MNAAVEKYEAPMVPQVQQAPRTMLDTIHEAVMRGISIEVINNMVALHKQFAADAAKLAFDNAFAKAKAEIGVIDKDAHVGFKQKSGQASGQNDKDAPRTDYDHDTLAGIYDAAVPALSKYGLSHSFDIDQVMSPGMNPGEFAQTITVTCIISGHGHSKQVKMSGPPDFEGNKKGLKAIASAITMMSRYALRAALGLASRKDKSDDDGAAAEDAAIKRITEEQLAELLKISDEVEANKILFCQWFKVKSFADIPPSRFDEAKTALETKRGATSLRVRGDGVPA